MQVTDNDYFNACTVCEIVLFVFGIINPNYETTSNSGEFQVGVYQNSKYAQFNGNSGEINMQVAPGYLNLYLTTVDNYYSRTDNEFTFNFSTSVAIPSAFENGAL